MRRYRMLCLLLFALPVRAVDGPGERPYELVWANRVKDDHAPLVDFERLDGWTVETKNAVAKLERSTDRRLWDDAVGKVTYHGDGLAPSVMLRPPHPLPLRQPCDTVQVWAFGDMSGWENNASRPPVALTVHLSNAAGAKLSVFVNTVNYHYWHLNVHKLPPDVQAQLKDGPVFTGLEITGGRNTADRVLYLDDLAFYQEELKPLTWEPRPQRGVAMFPGQGVGANTGPGKLPFPTRPETILPPNLAAKFTTTLAADGAAWTFTYAGPDGTLRYRLTPKTGTWSDLTAEWVGRGQPFQPLVGGGVAFAGADGKTIEPTTAALVSARRDGDTLVCVWRLTAGDISEVTYTYRLWNKSLVIDTKALGGRVVEVRYGRAVGLVEPRVTQLPYYVYSPGRPSLAISGTSAQPLFVMGNTDWYRSNASQLYGGRDVSAEGTVFNGGARYLPKTDGRRNDVFERFFLTVSPRVEEVLPVVDNPTSPWKKVTGTGVWRAHGAGNRERDIAYWRQAYRHGLRHLIITDHETMWRDMDESFTFRTKAAPGKGGDEGAARYSEIMQKELGFVYGPYNNFTDFSPVNEFWSPDRVMRTEDGNLMGAWYRCYAPKATWSVEACAKLSPINQSKYHFSTAYCDVHTAVAPWHRTDYDARAPGAGTFAATLYAYGEIMLHQKQAWGGPVYSEGGHHCFLHGLTDGNYGQDQDAKLPDNPWLVDFDLRRLHDLGCNFGMGAPDMFYGQHATHTGDGDFQLDRFLAATVAFGHPGFLVMEGGYPKAMRSYFMIQQLASRYTQASIASTRYADAQGVLHDSSAALGNGCYTRSQVVNTYTDGTITVVNGSPTERLVVTVAGRPLDLPPAGYAGWTKDGVDVFAGEVNGRRVDSAVSPDYLYIDGRGRFARLPRAGAQGVAVCRKADAGQWEIIALNQQEAGFDLGCSSATAVALDEAGKPIGPATTRVARGLVYCQPVAKAFSYLVTPGQPAVKGLTCPRDLVVAGETVTITGRAPHPFTVPAKAAPGERIWQQEEGQWIDFTVVPLADVAPRMAGNAVEVELTSNLAAAADVTVSLLGHDAHPRLEPRRRTTVSFELGAPRGEALLTSPLVVTANGLRLEQPLQVRTVREVRDLLDLPERFQVGMRLRKQAETTSVGDVSAARASATLGHEASSGGVIKTRTPHRPLLEMHPPWTGGVGYVFARFEPVTLPAAPAAALRGVVGKGDGSFLGDGIWYQVVVIDAAGKDTVAGQAAVTKHEWVPITADLSAWAGQTIRLKLIADVGPNDDSSGDWAKWADLRLESRDPVPNRTLSTAGGKVSSLPGLYGPANATVAQLRAAKSGKIHYDGANLAGIGQYESFAVVNGVKVGNMAPAGGDPDHGKFTENVTVPLTREAIATLGARNTFSMINRNGNCFKLRRIWLELELSDGRKVSSQMTAGVLTQPYGWLYFEGEGFTPGENFAVELWFEGVD